ncbi:MULTISPECIES: methyltransferase [unclassified Pseudomonas]|uniref:methyltransferase n=1 Tax=unclassified Pseudomonas TaxID=196821 RepID=UPI000BDAC636|nr:MULTISPECIES: methyltransferase [unclassified Pseudomonas]PVZ10338.1 methyltransferase family protein [Pseudomonas sp. URIL14HWK12:I12]PVZ21764.1 methyltransferase family protein [Pseudomonas sp. URIL14HWK12:I10]PVZ31153.1 methyltransferase family protein [Pseudomonas sp. URIL14HWK12:I11]SNZ17890.1 Dimethyladenosine transferase (rRNA methylation) [Pseudomonas sp. URIL14HWK12:I9]
MAAQALHGAALRQRFEALGAFLREHQGIWRPRPFTQLQCPWEQQWPALAAWLRAQSLEHAETAHHAPGTLAAPPPFPEWARQAQALAEVGPLPAHPAPPPPGRLSVDVPGRKWQQIEAFAQHLSFAQAPNHWLDWCAGKGHLGRRLVQPGQQLTCLEYDPALVASGAALSQRLGLPAEHIQQDVLASTCEQRLAPGITPVALHACGDLHVRLLALAAERGVQQLAIAPCCYNRIQASHYTPLSQPARALGLELDKDDLGLPASETVTAGARVRRQRDQSMAWRLAFDLWQREAQGSDHYLPTPPLPSAAFAQPFPQWCQAMAALKGLALPDTDWAELEARGWQRLAHVRNLELPRNLFRRPLELWLTLDRALYMQEHGYHTTVGTFCARELTPRNLMLVAQLPR